MDFVGFLNFAVKCFDVVAWPLFALGYPLCASIRAIETNSNSDTQKLVTYWVLFSLISLFEHAFVKLLAWLPFWPYIKLMTICSLVIPHFDGAFYVYKHLVRHLSMNLQIVINHFSMRKESFVKKEVFLAEAKSFVEENESEALEEPIASKPKCKVANVAQKDINPNLKVANVAQKDTNVVEGTERKEGIEANFANWKMANVAQKDTNVVEGTDRKEGAEANYPKWKVANVSQKDINPNLKVVNVAQKDTNVVEGTERKERVETNFANWKMANVAQKDTNAVEGTDRKEGAEANCPNLKVANVVQKDTNVVEGTERKEGAEANFVHRTETNLAQTENKKFSAVETKGIAATTGRELPNIPVSKKVQKEWTCAICQVTTQSETTLNSHLRGRKHKDACEVLKSKNQAAKNKGSPAPTANKSEQRKEAPEKCVSGKGLNQETTKKREEKTQNQQQNWKKGVNVKQKKPVVMKQSTLWCYICNISCTGEVNLASHCKGRKHLARIQELTGLVGGGQL